MTHAVSLFVCSCSLLYAQRHMVETSRAASSAANVQHVFRAMPFSHQPFHWPRQDLDNLLCVCVSEPESEWQWSGGFLIDCVGSFHVQLRNQAQRDWVLFLRVEVLLQGATFHVVCSDVNNLPPPYRIRNCSPVSASRCVALLDEPKCLILIAYLLQNLGQQDTR